MSATFDAIVIGSGFGGAITACRLAEQGMKVLDSRARPALGGEGLPAPAGRCLALQPPRAGAAQWLARHEVLQEHRGLAGGRRRRRVARLQQRRARSPPVAVQQRLARGNHLRRAEALLRQSRPRDEPADLAGRPADPAVSSWRARRPRRPGTPIGSRRCRWRSRSLRTGTTSCPTRSRRSTRRRFTNAQGQQQGTCIHLGNCDIGCDVRAKNTLDLNYVPLAERHGAEVRPLHIVSAIERSNGGYR